MPNHVSNELNVYGKSRTISHFLNTYFTKGELDFNKIIPEPTSPDGLNEKYILKDGEPFEKFEGKEWFHWYAWRHDNWNTKWNAYETSISRSEGKRFVTIKFLTAWSPCLPIIKKLIEDNKTLEFDYGYVDEGYEFCGSMYGIKGRAHKRG